MNEQFAHTHTACKRGGGCRQGELFKIEDVYYVQQERLKN